MSPRTRTTPISRLLKRHKLTSADVESICSVSRQTVHNWRTGAADISLENVAPLMAALNRRGIKSDLSDFIASSRKKAA